MSARRRRRVAALLAALPLAAACSSPPPPVPPPGEQARAISLPFDRYDFTPADLSVIERAEDLLVGDCMPSRGLAWETLPPSAEEDLEPPNRRRYGVVEPEIARRYGYHVAPRPPLRGPAERGGREPYREPVGAAAAGRGVALRRPAHRHRRGTVTGDGRLGSRSCDGCVAVTRRVGCSASYGGWVAAARRVSFSASSLPGSGW